ncbi:hypothetical protein PPS11_43763 [Pseudomonas putida S11]|nr:hypothetical protein PPS11_43763 [Pseudomonas putida S11]
MHGQVTRPQALLAGFPAGLVVLRADGLQHRDVATERAQVWAFRAGQGKAGGVEQHLGTYFVQPGFDLLQAGAFLEAGHGDRQRVEPGGLQALAEHIDERGVGRLQVRAVEQQWRHRLFGDATAGTSPPGWRCPWPDDTRRCAAKAAARPRHSRGPATGWPGS